MNSSHTLLYIIFQCIFALTAIWIARTTKIDLIDPSNGEAPPLIVLICIAAPIMTAIWFFWICIMFVCCLKDKK
jgi:hypothetical protein